MGLLLAYKGNERGTEGEYLLDRSWVVRSTTNLIPPWSEAASTTKVARDGSSLVTNDTNKLLARGRLRWATVTFTTSSQAAEMTWSQAMKPATLKAR